MTDPTSALGWPWVGYDETASRTTRVLQVPQGTRRWSKSAIGRVVPAHRPHPRGLYGLSPLPNRHLLEPASIRRDVPYGCLFDLAGHQPAMPHHQAIIGYGFSNPQHLEKHREREPKPRTSVAPQPNGAAMIDQPQEGVYFLIGDQRLALPAFPPAQDSHGERRRHPS